MPESRNPTETEDTNQEIFHAARLVLHQIIFLSLVLIGVKGLGSVRVNSGYFRAQLRRGRTENRVFMIVFRALTAYFFRLEKFRNMPRHELEVMKLPIILTEPV